MAVQSNVFQTALVIFHEAMSPNRELDAENLTNLLALIFLHNVLLIGYKCLHII